MSDELIEMEDTDVLLNEDGLVANTPEEQEMLKRQTFMLHFKKTPILSEVVLSTCIFEEYQGLKDTKEIEVNMIENTFPYMDEEQLTLEVFDEDQLKVKRVFNVVSAQKADDIQTYCDPYWKICTVKYIVTETTE